MWHDAGIALPLSVARFQRGWNSGRESSRWTRRAGSHVTALLRRHLVLDKDAREAGLCVSANLWGCAGGASFVGSLQNSKIHPRSAHRVIFHNSKSILSISMSRVNMGRRKNTAMRTVRLQFMALP